MSEDRQSAWQRMFPWVRAHDEYTVKYKIDSANAPLTGLRMHIKIYENGKRLREEGYLLWSNLTWARLWTPWFIWKAKRAKRKDEKLARMIARDDVEVSRLRGNRFAQYDIDY